MWGELNQWKEFPVKALIIVDVQNDFCPGGALAVRDGDRVVPIINSLQGRFDLVVATQDWHPADHLSFADNHNGLAPGEMIELNGKPQVLWPDHCVQDTQGAAFVAALDTGRIARVFQKGTAIKVDSYSGFFDNDHIHATGLGDYLRENNVDEVYVCGLATDYCVKFSALDARSLGFITFLIEDASRGVELQEGDVRRAVEEMRAAGVKIVQSSEVIR
jgi:nicotinamidase/pyrazinamidase